MVGRFGEGCRCAAVRVTDCVRERGGPGRPAPGTEWPTSQRLGYAAGGRWVANRAVTVTVDREGGKRGAPGTYLHVMYSWAGEDKRDFDGPFKLQNNLWAVSTAQYRTGGLRGPILRLVGRRRGLGEVKGDRPQLSWGVLDCWNRKRRESTP